MQQTAFTDSFIKGMLGWIRWIASSIANLFQSGSSTSGSTSFLSWFAGNWVKILLILIVIGVVVDWIVWLARWRPYWVWFRKRRILLDNDVEDIDDDDLMMRYGELGRPRGGRGRADAYADDLYEYDGEEPLDDFDEDYDEPEDGDYDDHYGEEGEDTGEQGDDIDDEDFDALYDDQRRRGAAFEEDVEDTEELDEDDDLPPVRRTGRNPARRMRAAYEEDVEEAEELDEDDDLPPAHRNGRNPARRKLFARRRDSSAEAEDPFSIEGDFFDDLGEDPMDDVVTPHRKWTDARDEQDTSVYRRPSFLPGDEPGAVRGADEDEGWHSGYTQRSVERGKRRRQDAGA